jgi:hypothetical protein
MTNEQEEFLRDVLREYDVTWMASRGMKTTI